MTTSAVSNPTCDFYSTAVDLVGRGFSVLPIQPREKFPVKGLGASNRQKDPAVIQAWAERYPDSNVAIVADDEIVILESDDIERLREIVKNGAGRDIPETLMACGSSEARPHLFFKRTDKATNVGCLAVPGLFEARFVNQYVVAPGSVHPNGSVYRWLNDAPIVAIPDWLVSELARLALTQKNDRKNPTVQAGPDGKVPEGGRHYELFRQLGKQWTGKQTEEELLEWARDWNDQNCNPPMEDWRVCNDVRDIMKREPYEPGPKVLLLGGKTVEPGNVSAEPIRPNGGHFDFVLSPPADGIDGAFALGSVHLIFGSSGTGKSTLGLQMLRAQAAGQPFFGHASFGRSYLYCMKDRGRHETARTFGRLQVDDSVPVAQIAGGVDWQKAADSIKQKFLEAGQPEIVFIEGLDMCLEEPNNPSQVGLLMESLMDLADRYHLSVIGTVGAPKLKKSEQYSPRDGMFGSSFWARKADTMVKVTENHDTGLRDVILMYRNSAQEKFTFQFTGGRMEPVEVQDEDGGTEDGVLSYLAEQDDWVTAKTIRAALLMSEPTVRRALKSPSVERQEGVYPPRYRLKRA